MALILAGGVIILLQFLLVALLFAYIVYTLAALLSDFTDVPFVATPRSAYKAIADSLEIVPGDIVYELGSGLGGFLLYAAQREPKAQYVGVERNRLLLFIARARQRAGGHSQNVEFRRGNFYTTNLTDATKIYAYLLHSVMNKLLPNLQKQFRGKLASRAFQFSAKPVSHTIELRPKPGMHGQNRLHIYDF